MDMKQREVTDTENIRWVCIQALAGAGAELAEKAADKMKDEEGKIPVVCTPAGGAQSVRIQLSEGWTNNIADEELLRFIEIYKSS